MTLCDKQSNKKQSTHGGHFDDVKDNKRVHKWIRDGLSIFECSMNLDLQYYTNLIWPDNEENSQSRKE